MRTLFILFTLLLVGCSSQPTPTAYLDKGTAMTLPAPVLATPFYRQQLLTASVGGRSHQLMTVLEADGRQLTLVGLTPSGVRLFRVRYDQQGIATEQLSPLLTGGMPPVSQVLADVMLCYWPLASWQSQLPPGWTLRDSVADEIQHEMLGVHGGLSGDEMWILLIHARRVTQGGGFVCG